MASEIIMRGRAWVFGDYTDSYQILPQQYWHGGDKIGNLDPGVLGEHAMEGAEPLFAKAAKAGEYQFIVAGKNFGGGGKSIEHPIMSLKGAGVKAVIAESASRYFFRNAINNGLATLVSEGISKKVSTGDELEVNLNTGEIKNLTTGQKMTTQPLPPIVLDIIAKGGYINYTKAQMSAS